MRKTKTLTCHRTVIERLAGVEVPAETAPLHWGVKRRDSADFFGKQPAPPSPATPELSAGGPDDSADRAAQGMSRSRVVRS